ncbi:YhjD/YihY/BrkB family envelope integrity protein [Diaminobutyricimonas sp. TR449]|uniref:YhjD/YihY/BrkB family envelope integrity protein n=1 Tax=Diaminobutyricimonas sp. TR449 TaxID=2708076 RepID=UPI00141E947E|nr:YhjD/YihY/BrkB family envelope integrity protein [Diaminobutyricimonas sp. TR449]
MTAEQPENPGATRSAQDGGEKRRSAIRSARSWVETRLRTTAVGRFIMRIANALIAIEVFDRAMTLAAQAFISILPLVIAVAALRRGDAEPIGRGLSNYLGLSDSAATALERIVPASSDVFSALGWFGVLLLVVSATAFSRALERFYARVWSKPKLGFRAAWRLFAVLAAILLGVVVLQLTRSILRSEPSFVPLRGIIEFMLWAAVWLIVGWIVLNRTVSFRLLLPGAVLCGIGLAIAGGVGRIYLPIALTSSAAQFGALGITIAYVGWLFVLMSVVVVAVTIGQVLTMDYGVLNRVQPRGRN